MTLQEPQRAVDSAAIYAGIDLLRLAENLAGIEVLARCFHHAENGPALLGHAYSPLGKVGLQSARNFGLWQWHAMTPRLSQLVATRMQRIFSP